ncbi:YopJ family acetyltransferase [Paracidovorax cattleyae]|uniref:YopJ family acetyltransferase n=1 Tax=Paracidovorax cattleyae TaxID=80868 RepID=UPI001CEF8AE2|nr:YopJ family acetyltransferase [Paracidovorax cattleyae]
MLDNTAALSRMGFDPRAQLLCAPPERRPLEAAAPGALFLPVALPVPPAPVVALPSGDPVAAQRRQVVDGLGELRAFAAEVHAEGASPDDEPDAFRKLDKLAMPAIVSALNAEDPQLRLVYAHASVPDDRGVVPDHGGFGSVEWRSFVADAAPGRWRVVLDNAAHNLALDLHVEGMPGEPGRRCSVVHMSSSVPESADPILTAAEMAAHLRLPEGWPLLLVDVPAQKSLRSCRIFALSMALKCAADASLEDLHARQLRGEPPSFDTVEVDAELLLPAEYSGETGSPSDGSTGDSAHGSAAVRDVNPASPQPVGLLAHYVKTVADVLGPAYMKHAQSRTALQGYLDGLPHGARHQPVNRKGQTLLERHDAHRVARWPQPAGHKPGPLLQSASIELKRIAFLDKAIRHAAGCSAQAILPMSEAMDNVDSRWRDWYRH